MQAVALILGVLCLRCPRLSCLLQNELCLWLCWLFVFFQFHPAYFIHGSLQVQGNWPQKTFFRRTKWSNYGNAATAIFDNQRSVNGVWITMIQTQIYPNSMIRLHANFFKHSNNESFIRDITLHFLLTCHHVWVQSLLTKKWSCVDILNSCGWICVARLRGWGLELWHFNQKRVLFFQNGFIQIVLVKIKRRYF